MLPKPKSEEVMKIVADLLELEKGLYSQTESNRMMQTKEIEIMGLYIDGKIVNTYDYYKARQQQLFKELIELVDGKKV